MNLSGKQVDATRALIAQQASSTSSMSLSGAPEAPVPYGSETDPVFSAWDKHTGITIHPSQIVPDAASAVPTGLTVTPIILSYGESMSSMYLQWDIISGVNYCVRYKKPADSNYLYGSSVVSNITIPNLFPGTTYDFAVASINISGVYSAFSDIVSESTNVDTFAPDTVVGLTATPLSGAILLSWTANSEGDLKSYNIYRCATSGGTKVLLYNVSATSYTDNNTGGIKQYYWIKAVDTSGNISASYSSSANATPIEIFTQSVLEAELGVSLTNVATIDPLTGYIGANMVGSTSLDDGTITASKILAGAVTAAKLDVLAISPTGELNINTVGTTQIATGAVEAANIATEAITANAIAVNAVTGPAIEASAITAGKLAVGAVTAEKILAGAVTANKITSYNFIVSAGTFTSNTPAGCVTWASCKVVYAGTEYTITNGNCDSGDKHIYWELATPTVFLHTVSLPALTNNGFLVAFNDSGTYRLVWNSTVIDGNRITTGSITASNIAAGTITADEIAADAITADKIKAGEVTAEKIKSYNFMLNSEGVWTNNSPSSGKIAWSGVTVTYDGITKTISDGNCEATHKWIYWENGATTISSSSTLPVLHNGDFIIGTNGNSTGTVLAGTMIFNIGGTVIDGNQISTGSITASQIRAGSITANEIETGTITSGLIKAGEIKAVNIATGVIDTSKLSFTPVGTDDIVATINASTEGIEIAASKITISGDCTFSSPNYDPSTKTKTFSQDAQPTAISVGDLWIDTNSTPINQLFRCSSLGPPQVWVSMRDAGIIDMTTALAQLSNMSNDNVLSVSEKQAVVKEYNAILAQQIALDSQAVTFSVSSVAYDAAVAALTSYLVAPGLSPYAYDDFTVGHDSTIVGTTFRQKFKDVYDAAATLQTLLGDAQGDWVQTTIDGGLITTGTIVVGSGAAVKAGMSGDGSTGASIRFWAGAIEASKSSAPFRVDDDGNMVAESGYIGGWKIDDDAMYTGTKHTGDGFSHANTDTTIAADGSIHAPNFYINTDGTTSFRAAAGSAIGGITSITVELGTWAMDTEHARTYEHGLLSSRIRYITVLVIGDDGTTYPLEYPYATNSWAVSGQWWFDATNLHIDINTNGAFHGSNHDSTASNRGYYTIYYSLT